jgi:predicted RNase H-related nuclease YkuK (DUF458 family)
MKFKDAQNNLVRLEDIHTFMTDKKSEYEIYVGTDSKVKKKDKKVIYATCIVIYKKGKGGKILISKERKNLPNSLRERLAIEVWRSIEISMELNKVLPDVQIVVHVDVNQSPKFKSGDFCQELVSMVVGQGFKCLVKPEAWAAQSVADKFSKKGD